MTAQDYSILNDEIFIKQRRREVAHQIISVLQDFLTNKKISTLSCLEIGTSSGIMSYEYAKFFKNVTGVDIDRNASRNWNKYKKHNIKRYLMDATHMKFKKNTFDVVITNQDYEFVSNSQNLMNEIYKVLKPGGICFFGARNRITFLEGQYRIPFLSIVPTVFAPFYAKFFGKKTIYIGKYKTYWGLKKLCQKFTIFDYTIEIIQNPKKYKYNKMLKHAGITKKIPRILLKILLPIIPNYIWVLQKPA